MTTPAYQPLISLADVKGWLAAESTAAYPSTSDILLGTLIGAASRFAVKYLQRPIVPATFTETYNGNGRVQLMLRQTPILQVRSLTIYSTSIQPRSAPGQAGFVADDNTLYLDGGGCLGFGAFGSFAQGIQNVTVTYDAGYQFAETWTVPPEPTDDSVPGPAISASQLERPWNADRGVAYATGAALTAVNVTPTVAGTYQLITDAQGNASYIFAVADVGASVAITYGYTPESLQQALIELVGERYKAATRIGQVSKTVAQQTTSYSQKDMNATIRTLLQPYRNVVPA